MTLSTVARGALITLAVSGLGACGSHSLSPAARSEQFASVSLEFKVASQSMRGIAVSAYAEGARPPRAPSVVADITGETGCAANADGSRTCTVALVAPVGLDDFTLTVYDSAPVRSRVAGRVVASGTILRQGIAPERDAFGVTIVGPARGLAITPRVLVAPADGEAQDVPFAVLPVDANGFYVLGATTPAVHIATSGDPLQTLAIDGPQSNPAEFVAHYDGRPAGDVKLKVASSLRPGSGDFTPLVVSPSSLNLAPSQRGSISVSQALATGAFEARVTHGACSVSPASLAPARAGAPVQFSVSGNGSGSCTVAISGGADAVPIAIPIPVVYGRGSLGLGVGPSKIKHIIFMVQENRSFDNIFGGLDSNGKPFPGADTVSNPNPGEPTPSGHKGNPIKMKQGLLEECHDPVHYHANSVTEVNGGKMNGFDLESVSPAFGCTPSPVPTNYVYRYIKYSEVKPYWQMGEQYAVSDRMFEPYSSASFGPHLYIVAGQSDSTIDNPLNGKGPWGCDATGGTFVYLYDGHGNEYPGVFPCFSMPTLADVLDARGMPWRWYATDTTDKFGYNWNAYRAINQIFNGPDWTSDIVTPPAQIITDVGSGALAAMTWVTPTDAASDHPQSANKLGPAWITSVVNAVGTSSFWDSTAIFIIWDDWGGWYDHVPPPVAGPVQDGIRVPFIAISPYIKAGYVSHVVHTSGSVLHFAEEALDLPSLGQEDARDDDLSDMFKFSQTPIPFHTFAPVRGQQDALRAPARDLREPPAEPNRGD